MLFGIFASSLAHACILFGITAVEAPRESRVTTVSQPLRLHLISSESGVGSSSLDGEGVGEPETGSSDTTAIDLPRPDRSHVAAFGAPAQANALAVPVPERYLASSELDARPYPLAPVILPFPDNVSASQSVGGILQLYIGVDGQVDYVELVDLDMPPEFADVAISTFKQVRMRPGMKGERAVRTRMRVYVEFQAH